MLARKFVVAIEWPAARTLTKKNRHLADRARPGHRRAPAGAHPSWEHIGDGISGFTAQKPSRENRVGAPPQPRPDNRCPGQTHNTHGTPQNPAPSETALRSPA